MKTIQSITIIALTVLIILNLKDHKETDLEIYTSENIYYIRGLTITTESDERKITFDNPEDLKTWLSNETADDSSVGN